MKRFVFSLLALMALCVSCGKDDITTVVNNPDNDSIVSDVVDTTSPYLALFDRKVVVVFSTEGAATVTGIGDSLTATVSGNDVTVNNLSSQKVLYILTGSNANGFLKIYSGKKQGLQLNNLHLRNQRGAAINIQGLAETPNKGKRTDIYTKGECTLFDGSVYTLTPDTEDEKAALFSEGRLVFNGSGSLTVTATGKAAITTDDEVEFLDGCNVSVTSSAGHGVRGKNYILVNGGTLDISVSADGKKGMSSDSSVRFEGGSTTIHLTGNTVVESGDTNRSNAIKADSIFEMNAGTLTITNSGTGGKGISCDGKGYFRGGTIDITVTGQNFGSSSGGGGPHPGPGPNPGGWGSSDNSVGAKGIKCDGNIEISDGVITVRASYHEGIETKGTLTVTGGEVYSQSSDDAINSASTMTISGGMVCAYSTGNDGLDANGNLYLQGGLVYAIGTNSPEVAVDANTEGGFKLYVQGGTLIAIGGLENGAQLSQSCYKASSWNKNTWYSMTVGSQTYAFKTPTSGGSGLIVSGAEQPVLKSGVTATGGTESLNGMLLVLPEVSGGSAVSLSSYTGGGGWW
ncbi:MAG: carbohydrate-binding domain-containing protein [bacterium]